jgi:hypothetical protein
MALLGHAPHRLGILVPTASIPTQNDATLLLNIGKAKTLFDNALPSDGNEPVDFRAPPDITPAHLSFADRMGKWAGKHVENPNERDNDEVSAILNAMPVKPRGETYQPPRRLVLKRIAYQTLSWTSWGAAGATLIMGLGAPASLLITLSLATLLAIPHLYPQDIPVPTPNLPFSDKSRFRNRARKILDALRARDPGLPAVEIQVQPLLQSRRAYIELQYRPIRLTLHQGWQDEPLDWLASVIGHELGHTLKTNKPGLSLSSSQALMIHWIGVGLIALATSLKLVLPQFWGLWNATDFLQLASGNIDIARCAFLAAVLWSMGCAFIMAMNRQEEYAADHYGAWLTRPSWLKACLNILLESQTPEKRRVRLYDYLYSAHPPPAQRIRWLAAMEAQETSAMAHKR